MCITFSPPKAKPNSSDVNIPQILGLFGALWTAVRIFRRPSAAPSDASINQAVCPEARAEETFSKPEIIVPPRRASPSPSRTRLVSSRSTWSARSAGAVSLVLAERENKPFLAAVATASRGGVDPHAAAGQLARHVRDHRPVGPDHEPHQTRLVRRPRPGRCPCAGDWLRRGSSPGGYGACRRRSSGSGLGCPRRRASDFRGRPGTWVSLPWVLRSLRPLRRRPRRRPKLRPARSPSFLELAFLLDIFRLGRGLDPAHDDAGAHDQRLGVFRRQVEGCRECPASRTRSPFLVSNQPRRSSGIRPARSSIRLHVAFAQGHGHRAG